MTNEKVGIILFPKQNFSQHLTALWREKKLTIWLNWKPTKNDIKEED